MSGAVPAVNDVVRMASPPLVVVLTGGSGVGKTTLIDRLASLGFSTVPEAAMQVITLSTRCSTRAAARRASTHNGLRQSRRPVALQQEQRALRSSSNVLFLDRSVLDNLGYARVRGYDQPAFLTEELVQSVAEPRTSLCSSRRAPTTQRSRRATRRRAAQPTADPSTSPR